MYTHLTDYRVEGVMYCEVVVPSLMLGHVCLFTGLQRNAEAESRAETKDEAKFSFHRNRGS